MEPAISMLLVLLALSLLYWIYRKRRL